MNPKHMLYQLAQRYHDHGPIKRQQDAQVILQMIDAFDQDTARTYLERFVHKWNLLDDPGKAAPQAPTPQLAAQPSPSSIRRRPMSELEQRIYHQLLTAPTQDQEPATKLTIVEQPLA